jgi:hypothetical protein
MALIHYNEPAPLSDQEIVNALWIVRTSRVWASTLRPVRKGWSGEGDPLLLCFDYNNWRGEDHQYVVLPESIEFGEYRGDVNGEREGSCWLLHADIVTRDGDTRPEMGARRRTFVLADLREIGWVADQ